MRDFHTPSFNFLCARANRKGRRWTGREGGYVFHFVNQLPVRHPEELCHANASVAQIFLRKHHTLMHTSWLRKTEWVSIKTSTHKSTTKLCNFPSAVTNGGFKLILYTSSQLTVQSARHMVVLLFSGCFYNDVVGKEVVSCLLCVRVWLLRVLFPMWPLECHRKPGIPFPDLYKENYSHNGLWVKLVLSEKFSCDATVRHDFLGFSQK